MQKLLALFPKHNATAHIVGDKEYLVLRMDTADGTADMRQAEALLAQHSRKLYAAAPTSDPTELQTLCRQLSDQLDRTCRCAPTTQMDALIRAHFPAAGG